MISACDFTTSCDMCFKEKDRLEDSLCLKCQKKYVRLSDNKRKDITVHYTLFSLLKLIYKNFKDIKSIDIKYY